MKDFKAISKTYYGKIKSNLGIKKEYAKFFKEQDTDYYLKIFNDKPLIIQDFIKFVKKIPFMKILHQTFKKYKKAAQFKRDFKIFSSCNIICRIKIWI